MSYQRALAVAGMQDVMAAIQRCITTHMIALGKQDIVGTKSFAQFLILLSTRYVLSYYHDILKSLQAPEFYTEISFKENRLQR